MRIRKINKGERLVIFHNEGTITLKQKLEVL